jgi:hypothetical protein
MKSVLYAKICVIKIDLPRSEPVVRDATVTAENELGVVTVCQ